MKCPHCSSPKTEITNSRKKNSSVRRQRKCKRCGRNFVTLETVVEQQLRVQPSAGASVEKFDHNRLTQKLLHCLHDQRDRHKTASQLLEDISETLYQSFGGTVSPDDIQRVTANRLAQLHPQLADRYNALRTIDEPIELAVDEQERPQPNMFDD